MEEPELSSLLTLARARIGGARDLLAHPLTCNLDACVTLFREAEGYLEWLRDSLAKSKAGRGLRREAGALAGEIRQAGVLLEHAALLGRHWLERSRPADPEYTATGDAAHAQWHGHVSYLG